MFIVKGHGYQQDKQTRVERLFHKMLRVDVLYQLLLLTEAPHTVAALKELSLRPRWLSFICILWRSADHCQGWINSAHVTKDIIGLDAIDHLELTNERGESVQISKPILGVEVDKLRKLNPANEAEEKALSVQLLCEELQWGGEVGTAHR